MSEKNICLADVQKNNFYVSRDKIWLNKSLLSVKFPLLSKLHSKRAEHFENI